MTMDGGYLSGGAGRQSNANARALLQEGWREWEQKQKTGSEGKPVPNNQLPIYGGEELTPGALKLRVAYRDLPRGKVERPGNAQFPNPYNLGWVDFTAKEAISLLPADGNKKVVPEKLFRKLALEKLKDAVRGQMRGWRDEDLKGGSLSLEKVSEADQVNSYRLVGSAELRRGGLSFSPTLFGSAAFDTRKQVFTEFRLIAVGQRSGKGSANGRETDLGPAPMGVCFELYKKP